MILERQISVGSDDCYTFTELIRLTKPNIFIDELHYYMQAYIRFLNIDIPRGAIIDHAYIDLCSDGQTLSESTMQIAGIKEPNTNTFSTQPDVDARPMTDAYMDWILRHYLGNEAWNDGEWWGYTRDAHDIKDIIQEIVNQDGWVSGNALAIKIINTIMGGARLVYSFEGGQPPRLHIEYTAVITNGILSVSSLPVGANIFIQDELVGVTPYSLELPEGSYQLTLRLAGYQDYTTVVQVVTDQTTPVDITLSPITIPLPLEVTGLMATDIGQMGFRLSWNANPVDEGVTLYRVYLRRV